MKRPVGRDQQVVLRTGSAVLFAVHLLAASSAMAQRGTPTSDQLAGAARAGDLDVVKRLLQEGADSNVPDGDGNWALAEAIRGGHAATAEYLLLCLIPEAVPDLQEPGDRPDAGFAQALGAAVERRDNGILRRLLLYRRGVPRIPVRCSRVRADEMLAAAAADDAQAIRDLLRRRPPPDGRVIRLAFEIAEQEGHVHAMRVLLEPYRRSIDAIRRERQHLSLLRSAIREADETTARAVLEQGIDFNAHGEAALEILQEALAHDRLEILKLLVRHGVGIVGADTYLDAALRDAGFLELLTARGMDLNAKNAYGLTALMMAALRGDTGAVSRLLAAGAESALTDAGGRTALDLARMAGHEPIVEMLSKREPATK